MANVFDVAKYILEKQGPVTTMKLQKLVYFCQAWSLVWDEKPIFNERIEAWACGPVVPNLYEIHRGEFKISDIPKGDSKNLTKIERDTINAVLDEYGDKTAQWLSDLTHLERPWNKARGNRPAGGNCQKEITHDSLAEYYGTLSPPII